MPRASSILEVIEASRQATAVTSFIVDKAAALSTLKSAVAAGRLTLCVGAGISALNGIPEWIDLLTRIASRALGADDNIKFRKIMSARPEFSGLILARFLKQSFSI